LVVDATDGPDDFRHIRAGIAPAPRRAAVIAEAVARAQQDDAILEPQLELAPQHQADLLAHAGGEQLLARGAARFDTGAAQIQRASRRRRVHFLVDALVGEIDATMGPRAGQAAAGFGTALTRAAQPPSDTPATRPAH